MAAPDTNPLQPFVFTTDYNPSDFATLLQSGGIQLLDLQTLTALLGEIRQEQPPKKNTTEGNS